MPVETADIVVVGLGAMGAATLYQLALKGVHAVGIDRFHPPHDQGSSHGESRITRLAVGEGAAYAPLVRRSHEIWRQLEAQTGEQLMLQTGGLIMSSGPSPARHHGHADFVRSTIAVAEQAGVAHEVLDAAGVVARFPRFRLTGDEIACFEPTAGLVFPEHCIAVQLRLAAAAGAVTHLGEQVTQILQDGPGVTVVTDRRRIHAGHVVLTAGAWSPGLAGGALADTRVMRQSLHWFDVQDPAEFAPGRFPIFIWVHGPAVEDCFYGFPSLPGAAAGAVKIATEQYLTAVDPDRLDRVVSPEESAELHRCHIAERLPGVTPHARKVAACMYTVTPDSGFVIDTLPDRPGVTLASACSGHGFKHSAAVGELLAERATATTPAATGPFDLSRATMRSVSNHPTTGIIAS